LTNNQVVVVEISPSPPPPCFFDFSFPHVWNAGKGSCAKAMDELDESIDPCTPFPPPLPILFQAKPMAVVRAPPFPFRLKQVWVFNTRSASRPNTDEEMAEDLLPLLFFSIFL